MIDTSSPAGALLQKMATDLSDRRAHLTNLEDYYRGVNGIPVHAGRHVRESYQRLMQISRLNLARVIVEATRELMEPIGFRTGAAGDEGGDAEAWRIWQANSLDADHMLVDRATLSMARAIASAQRSTAGPSTSTVRPQVRHSRWWWCSGGQIR